MVTKQTLFSPPHRASNEAQLEAIWSICGTPDPREWPEIEKLEGYRMFQKAKPKPARLLAHLEKTIPREFNGVIPLLMQILKLAPSDRISAQEATLHEFFKEYGSEIEPSKLPPITSVAELHQADIYAERKKAKVEEQTVVSDRVNPEELS
jgi:serine/threonine protein kinase